MTPTIVYCCPLIGCSWGIPEEVPTRWSIKEGETIADAVNRGCSEVAARTEARLAEHAASHTPRDYLETIKHLRQTLGNYVPADHPLMILTAEALKSEGDQVRTDAGR